ncbi:uncharacterized protein CIMG_13677 [Coccidioides immitis RS]|uniref:Aminoglycoside phosphotransferase domain-containing protein n=2 Tax=Coccidioides immitis TaxID=5501 RepID=J3KAJ8_COCIM|nr:uncharacterized protein CIMG_13677 [Coccidioides immitis RS]EAS32050.3 hypothetical protein CIMG_13677 [Coccidioides immitis RS]
MPSSCSSCSSRSGTSTVYYGHTAFTEFSGQVRHLCQVLWPQSSPEGTTIERLTGGSYNRVIGLSIDNVNTDAIAPPQAARFILRIPRFESAQVENQIATLSFLKQRTQIPIPKIVLFDLTPENAIDSPYTVQLRISGLDLQTGYQTLSHAQRCSFLGTVAEEMDARGCFGESEMVLCHTDLSPRNIMVEAAPDGSLRICGILDWDGAVFGPRVMSCAPPSWIWQWCEDGEEDEATASLDPQDPQLRELKSIFEEEVGQDLLNLAYLPHHRLARRLCDFALYGISCKEHIDNADRLSAEWQ